MEREEHREAGEDKADNSRNTSHGKELNEVGEHVGRRRLAEPDDEAELKCRQIVLLHRPRENERKRQIIRQSDEQVGVETRGGKEKYLLARANSFKIA